MNSFTGNTWLLKITRLQSVIAKAYIIFNKDFKNVYISKCTQMIGRYFCGF